MTTFFRKLWSKSDGRVRCSICKDYMGCGDRYVVAVGEKKAISLCLTCASKIGGCTRTSDLKERSKGKASEGAKYVEIVRDKTEISDMHGYVLEYLDTDEGKSDWPDWSFECGVLAAIDWLQGVNSVYADAIHKDMIDYITNREEGEDD